MSLKFGSIFNDIGAGFQKAMDSALKNYEGNTASASKEKKLNVTSVEVAGEAFRAAADAAAQAAQSVVLLEDELIAVKGDAVATAEVEKKLAQARKEATILAGDEIINKKLLTEVTEELIAVEEASAKTRRKGYKTIEDTTKGYEADLKRLASELAAGTLSTEGYSEEMSKLKTKMQTNDIFGTLVKGFSNSSAIAVDAGEYAASAIASGLLKFLPPGLNVLGPLIEKAIMAAFIQVVDLNKQLVELQRATGGLAIAARLGYDSFGNAEVGMQSLGAATLAANVSVGEFSESMQSLFRDGFGQTIGVLQDLDNSQKELQNFGIEAAKLKKYFGADIGPAVQGLVKNWGSSVGEATKIMGDGAKQAQVLGLSVSEYTKNFEQVTNLIGEVYFKTNEEMSKMAMIATQLGTSVNALAKGALQMNSITDLFRTQQKAAALGLHDTARAAAKIFALRQTGRGAEAAQLELASMASDIQKQGMLGAGGTVTQQGITTLEASGASKEQITAISNMARQAERTGLSFDQLGDTTKLTRMQQIKLNRDMAENGKTLGEQFDQIAGGLKHALIDPLAKIFAPIINNLLNVLQPLVDIVIAITSAVFDFIDVFLTPLQEVSNQVAGFLTDILNPLKDAFQNITKALAPMFNMLKTIGTFVVKFLFIPFRVVGKVIGGIISVFAKIIQVIGDKLAPIFEWVSGIFGDGGGMIDDVLDGITAVFGWLADTIGMLIGGAIDLLIDAFKFLGKLLQPLIDAFKALWDGIKAFGDWLNIFNDSTDVDDVVNVDWNKLLGATQASDIPTPITASTPTATGPSANPAPSTTADAVKNNQLMSNAFNIPGKTSTIVNVHTEASFGSKQTMKSS